MLKHSLLAIVFTTLFITASSYTTGGLSDVVNAISRGSSRDLALHLADNVEISLPEKDGFYSKPQAEQIMNNFFRQYPPQSFKITHQSGGNNAYFIGNYDFGRGTYRVTGFFKNTATGVKVHSLKFEKP